MWSIEVRGGGSGLLVTIGEQLRVSLGETFRWLFLIGAFGAVFSSLLGVWQSVPYVFADFCGIVSGANDDGLFAGAAVSPRLLRTVVNS